MLLYDCEIYNAIQNKNEPKMKDITYCEGWRDFNNMGISCISSYDYKDDRYRIFCEDNFDKFQELINQHNIIVGYNSLSFDNELCFANNIIIPKSKSYDILVEIWAAAGLGSEFEYPSHIGFGLNAVCKVNINQGKSGQSENAPILWQQGFNGTVIDYCLNDIQLTKKLLDLIIKTGEIIDPRFSNNILYIRKPYEEI